MDLQTVNASEIKMESLEERFENCVLNQEPFMPDTAVYYLNLRKNDSMEPAKDLDPILEQAEKCKTTIEMLTTDGEITVEQAWNVLCTPTEGRNFSGSLLAFMESDKGEQTRRGFKNLVSCLEKTSTIINSRLQPNGA